MPWPQCDEESEPGMEVLLDSELQSPECLFLMFFKIVLKSILRFSYKPPQELFPLTSLVPA